MPIDQIEHLVILMMENRSFDHYLGALTLPPWNRTDVEGLPTPLPTNLNATGAPIVSWPMDATEPGYPDPPHGYGPAHIDFNGGANDGFVKEYQREYQNTNPPPDPRIPMGYYTEETLPVLYALAQEFTICDHWFSSCLSSTWPNRKYLHCGQRDGVNDTFTLPAYPGFGNTPIYAAIEKAKDPITNDPLTWKCYFSDMPFLAFWYKFAAFHALDNFHKVSSFVDDCREDRLPTISVIDPPFSVADDHPSHDPKLGQKFIGLIVDALSHSPVWDKTALIILYDENGGFYDHVPPPPAPENPADVDTPLGFRVPAMIVSPYAKRGVCKVPVDHTAIMKFIAERWGVNFGNDYGTRWQATTCDFATEWFDFASPPRPQGAYTGDPITDMNWHTGVQNRLVMPGNFWEGLLEKAFLLPELKALDNRAGVYDTLSDLEQGVITLKRML